MMRLTRGYGVGRWLMPILILCWTAVTQAAVLPTIHSWDLRYLYTSSAELRYDMRHVAACIQGLANRDAPRLFVIYTEDDALWLNRLVEPGGLCEGWPIQPVADLRSAVNLFRDKISGVVTYDPDPSTGACSSSLAATTAAGVENGIAVRKSLAFGSVYRQLVTDPTGSRLPIVVDLTGKFTGSGTIWQTSRASTNSAKCDAYIWAKENYLDTGQCDPTTLMYTLDLWGLPWTATWIAPHDQLCNLDYAVARRGFCFELSPWGDEKPNDDPGQPLGTDLAVFKEILNSCNVRTGQEEMIKFCGFTNWDLKYSSHVGLSHDPVPTEWETVYLLSAYNVYLEGDAAAYRWVANTSFYHGLLEAFKNRRYVQNPAPSYNDLVSRGLINGSGQVVPGNYVLMYQGDYDQASWMLYWLAGDRYDDPVRGQIDINWALTPNSYDRVCVAFDYMFRNRTPKDCFISGESGAGYVNPAQLRPPRNPSGYPSGYDIWTKHCREYYRPIDFSITGWLLNGDADLLTVSDVAEYAPFSPDGIGMGVFQGISTPALVNNVPVLERGHYDNPGSGDIINKSWGVNFAWYRNIIKYPAEIKAVQDGLAGSGNNHHFLDAYSFYYLLRHHLGGNNSYRATWMGDSIGRILEAGKSYSVSVTVRNEGWDTWSESAAYRLGHAVVPVGVEPDYADYDSRGRAAISGGQTVATGQTVTFYFTLETPTIPGVYNLYYDLVRDGYTWFREQNNIEWKSQVIVAADPLTVDTDGDGVADVLEAQAGTLYWHPDDTVECGDLGYLVGDICSPSSGEPDCCVDIHDLICLVAQWLLGGGGLAGDLSGPADQPDGVVNLYDIAEIAAHWRQCEILP